VRVLGLDLSLTSTGVADICDGRTQVSRVRSTGRNGDSLGARQQRLARIVADLSTWWDANTIRPDLVVIEGPSLGQARQGGQHDRAGLWWLTVDHLMSVGLPVAEVPPALRAKYATGKGNAAKEAVLLDVARRYPDIAVDGNDTADALILAAMGARHLGAPIDYRPQTHLVAMHAVRWPTTEGTTP
jgi:crossover junction endodeoxyribonuclease RuvC